MFSTINSKRITAPCGHNNLSTVSLGRKPTDTWNGKEFTSCETCGKWHRRWWWNGKPNGWVGLA